MQVTLYANINALLELILSSFTAYPLEQKVHRPATVLACVLFVQQNFVYARSAARVMARFAITVAI